MSLIISRVLTCSSSVPLSSDPFVIFQREKPVKRREALDETQIFFFFPPVCHCDSHPQPSNRRVSLHLDREQRELTTDSHTHTKDTQVHVSQFRSTFNTSVGEMNVLLCIFTVSFCEVVTSRALCMHYRETSLKSVSTRAARAGFISKRHTKRRQKSVPYPNTWFHPLSTR